jgi:transposase-like protein
MPQLQLPIFPAGATHITQNLAFEYRDGRVTYFYGQLPVFVHAEEDVRTFRMITSQFVVNGTVTQAEIARAFGVTAISVKRAVKTYRRQGPGGFYAPRPVRGAVVLTGEVIQQLEDLLAQGMERGAAARHLGLKPNTVTKAMRAGRVRGKKSPARRGRWRSPPRASGA